VILPRTLRQAWSTSKVEAGIVILLGLVTLWMHTALERWSYDLPFKLGPEKKIDDLTMVYMDDISHGFLNQPYDSAWDRKLHARLLDVFTRCGVRAVALDIVFAADGKSSPGSTEALAQAIRHHGRVVLAADFSTSNQAGKTQVQGPILPAPELLSASPFYGFDTFGPTPDGIIREHWHGANPDAPSLSWKLGSVLGIEVTRDPKEQRRERWIKYYGPRGTLPGISLHAVLENLTPAIVTLLTNRIVFVGSATQAGFTGKKQDQYTTPFSDDREPYWPGVDIHATEFLNLLHQDWLRRMPGYLEMGLIACCGLAAALAFGFLRPQTAIWTAAGIAAVISIGAMFLVWQTNVWFAWLIIPVVQLPGALVLAIAKKRPARPLIPTDLTTEFKPGPTERGMTLGDHAMVRRIGHGSYGEVWLAKSATGAYRAVKVLDQKSATDPRFEREFAGLRKFEPVSRAHEGLVDILHVGRNDEAGQFYYVMELADSCTTAAEKDPEGYVPSTLKAKLQARDGISPGDLIYVSMGLTAALAFLHKQGLVHRDIKPSNIIFVEGHPKLADIGLVAASDETKSFVGTEGYIPPEGPGTPAADVYSLGKVLSEVAAANSTPPDRSIQNLNVVIQRASAQNCKERYTNAMEMLADLKKILGLNV
jgi:CHASE2 domain-containing sensor protein